MPSNAPALAWLRTTAESEDTRTAGHARAVLEMVEGLELTPLPPVAALRTITVAGEPFVCACGCNVFRLTHAGLDHADPVDTYECNACRRCYDAIGPEEPANA